MTLWCDIAFEPRPLALMHADSIREQLKKLLRRFNVRMISSEGIQPATIAGDGSHAIVGIILL